MTALLVWLVCLVCAALWYVLTASAAALTAAAALGSVPKLMPPP